MTSWFSATVLLDDPIGPIGVGGEFPLTACFLEVVHYMDGSRWSQSLVSIVSTTELLCVAH